MNPLISLFIKCVISRNTKSDFHFELIALLKFVLFIITGESIKNGKKNITYWKKLTNLSNSPKIIVMNDTCQKIFEPYRIIFKNVNKLNDNVKL